MGNLAPRILSAVAWFAVSSGVQAPAQIAPDASLVAAQQSINHGDYKKAETLLRGTLERSPASPDAHYLLGLVLFHEQRASDSLAEYTQGAHLRTPGPDELIGVASDYILLKDYQDADRWLTRATQLSPGLAKSWYLLGRTQYNENHITDAEQSFLTCLRFSPRDVRAEYNLGLVYEKSQRPEQAVEAYKTAIKWQENASMKDAQPFLDLGMLLRRQGHVEEALPYLLAAETAGPRNPMTHAEIGLCYEHLNRLNEAIAELEQAVVLSPHVEALHFFLGRVYRRAGRADDASREFAESAKLSGAKSNDGIPNEDVTP